MDNDVVYGSGFDWVFLHLPISCIRQCDPHQIFFRDFSPKGFQGREL